MAAMLLAVALPANSMGSAASRHSHGSAPSPVVGSLVDRCSDAATLPSADCGMAPTPAFDARGRLWIAFSQHGHVYVTFSANQGADFNTPVAVNRVPEPVYADGENRPKIAFGENGEIYVSWTRKTPGRYTGDIRFSRSIDDGLTFAAPITVNDDSDLISHRFDALAVDGDGNIYVVWLDKRDKAAAKRAGDEYAGAALYYAVSSDGGRRFAFNRKIADNSCECCRVALAMDGRNELKVMWRHVFDGAVRDHALVLLDSEGATSPLKRVTHDDWRTDACPHHGPDLSLDDKGLLHMTWFTAGPNNKGLMYGRYSPETDTTDYIRPLDITAGAAHPQVLVSGGRVFAAWKRFNGSSTELCVKRSDDGGKTWSDAGILATTRGDSDHPILLKRDNRVFVSWQTRHEGYRLVPVPVQAAEAIHAHP